MIVHKQRYLEKLLINKSKFSTAGGDRNMEIQSIKNRFGIIGNSPALNYALQVAGQVALTDLSVLIMGESGVGKEVFSQIIHALSARKHNPFIAVNCGAIPEGTIDSELFGHEKGSFTGAVDFRKGYFETVNGGTIFLDEIGELPLGTQARLLRVLETGEYIRVGSSKVHKTDVRVIAATNKDLLDQVHSGRFREDLYYRLSTVPIRVPALHDRKEDITLLFRKFAVDFAEKYKTAPVQLDEDAKSMLINYPWPGNVRELKNIADQVSVLSQDKQISSKELGRFLQPYSANRLPVLAHSNGGGAESFANEREILYKLFFDMKKDVTELKKMFFEVLQNPNAIQNPALINELKELKGHEVMQPVYVQPTAQPSQPVIMNGDIHEHTEVEESLNIMDKEKELIIKALKKHRGKRKDAALDLGISERTLYRKLKEYNIEE
jgi:DNA-binding NtrC family response regulator